MEVKNDKLTQTAYPGVYLVPGRPGVFKIAWRVGKPGNRRQKWATITGGSAFEANNLRAQKMSEPEAPPSDDGANLRVDASELLRDYFEYWRLEVLPINSGLTTQVGHEIRGRLHILPQLGHLTLAQLDSRILQRWITAFAQGAGMDRPPSRKTVVHVKGTLSQVLNRAAAEKIIPSNPMAGKAVTIRRETYVPKVEIDFGWVPRAIELLRDTKIFLAFLLALTCGLRRGEVAALCWRHVDFVGDKLDIQVTLRGEVPGKEIGPPKTPAGYRSVPLTAFTRRVLLQARERAIEQHGATDIDFRYVCAHESGESLSLDYITHAWRVMGAPALTRAGLPRLRFHDLRHLYFTILTGNNVGDLLAKRMMGHADPSASGLYMHITPAHLDIVRDAVETVIGQDPLGDGPSTFTDPGKS